jgi:biopolymer transport protein ExbD
MESLREALQQAMAKSGDSTVILQGDRSVVLERAVQIMSVAKEAGATKISIATAPPEQAGGP